jgi:hypothetical protein
LPIYLCYKIDCNAYANATKNINLLFLLMFYSCAAAKTANTKAAKTQSGKAFPLLSASGKLEQNPSTAARSG